MIHSSATVLVSRVWQAHCMGNYISSNSLWQWMLSRGCSLAAQDVLRWILKMQSNIGTSYTDDNVKDYLLKTLNSGQVVPGYGHAVLRRPDPRYEVLIRFASSRPEIAKDPLFQLVKKNSEIAPGVLKQLGKVKKT